MAKKKQQKTPREVTKRQLSRWRQQQRRQRLIGGLGILIIVAVLGIIGAGWYTAQYQPLRQTVITVNDTSFDMSYYIKVLKRYGEGQSSVYMTGLAPEIVQIIGESELVRQGAMKLGISVSDDEVDAELKSRNQPLSKDYRDLVRTEMLLDKLLEEYFEYQVPVSAEQWHIQAMFLESESQAREVTARLEAGEDFAELAGELSLDAFTKEEKGDLGWRPKDTLSALLNSAVPEEYTLNAEVGTLSQPLYDEDKTKEAGYWLIKILERKDGNDEAHIQVMLLASEGQANEVRARLEAGEDFAELAGELSRLENAEENGGDVGWLTPGLMSPAVDEFVFDPEVELETISEPIRDDQTATSGGYWLVKVLGKEDNRKLEDEDRRFIKGKALNEWVSSLWDDPENKIESFLDSEKIAWAVERATRS